ncbi:hypothetical protein PV327_011571, partial [Microctonus hyperodae]
MVLFLVLKYLVSPFSSPFFILSRRHDNCVIRWSEVKEDSRHQESSLKIIKTKFGRSIIVTLNDEFTVYLPKRIADFFLENEDVFKETSKVATDHKLTLHYIGGKYH